MNESNDQTSDFFQNVEIPSQSAVLTEIRRELNKEEPSFPAITEKISQDVTSTADILTISNSSMFGLRKQKITTVKKALSVLGIENFVNCILTSMMQNTLKNIKIPLEEFNNFNDHSVYVAKVAQQIAFILRNIRKLKVDHNHAYLTGLFHDCAIPIMADYFNDYYDVMREPTDVSLVRVEQNKFGMNHCIAGFKMGTRWDLPEIVCDIIKFHHNSDISIHEDQKLKEMMGIFLIAEYFVETLHKDSEKTPELKGCSPISKENTKNVFSLLGINNRVLQEIKKSASDIIIGRPQEEEEDLEASRQLLI
ncbi:MAG: HDOD domain-containing protein [Desulfobacterales bacterium]|nr:HDOD domain-containing protein [Desulfobacterales bacterium]MCP4163336.1 HDOD domain-containing protein [Deltaproteobacteria bacterium]